MSSARDRNKFCLSLDSSSSDTSSDTAHLNRWSEVVPPKTALTFAALWDPEEGMVTFSGAALLEPESLSGRSQHPDAFDDDASQFVSLERGLDGGVTPDENTATLTPFQDVFKIFLRHTPWDSREQLNTKAGQSGPRGFQTRASSTFDGLDIYSHDVQPKARRSVRLSCIDLLDMESSFRTSAAFARLRLRPDLMLDSYRLEAEGESNIGNRAQHLNSRFSTTTTTSTSNYIDTAISAAQSVHISETFPIPEWTQPNECISPAGSWPLLPRRRLLRKRRPFDGDGTTAATSSTPSSTPRKLKSKSRTRPSSSRSLFSTARVSSSSAALTVEEGRRGQFPSPMGKLISPTPTPTPPNSPSKAPRLKLRFSFLSKRKPRETSSDSEGWVCIEITPVIRQRYIANIDED